MLAWGSPDKHTIVAAELVAVQHSCDPSLPWFLQKGKQKSNTRNIRKHAYVPVRDIIAHVAAAERGGAGFKIGVRAHSYGPMCGLVGNGGCIGGEKNGMCCILFKLPVIF